MGKSVRHADWPERLHQFIEDRREAVFLWGERDCCLFAADALRAMCGSDFGAGYRGKYKSAAGAARILLRQGGVAGVADRFLVRAPTLMAGRGDVVLIDSPEGDALGVCIGRQIAAQGKDGVVFLELSAAKGAWKES